MVDLGTASAAISLVDKAHSLYRKIAGIIKRKPLLAAFEIRPLCFQVNLSGNRPTVEIQFYIINYLSRQLTLKEIKVTRLQLQGGDQLDSIPLAQEDFRVQAHKSEIVRCRRNLIDSEVRSLSSEKPTQSGTFELVAKAIRNSKEYIYGPVSSMCIEGRVVGSQT
ncbi:MAG: hypothetical protein AB7U82_35385 [Blastocatellales bacterium]